IGCLGGAQRAQLLELPSNSYCLYFAHEQQDKSKYGRDCDADRNLSVDWFAWYGHRDDRGVQCTGSYRRRRREANGGCRVESNNPHYGGHGCSIVTALRQHLSVSNRRARKSIVCRPFDNGSLRFEQLL